MRNTEIYKSCSFRLPYILFVNEFGDEDREFNFLLLEFICENVRGKFLISSSSVVAIFSLTILTTFENIFRIFGWYIYDNLTNEFWGWFRTKFSVIQNRMKIKWLINVLLSELQVGKWEKFFHSRFQIQFFICLNFLFVWSFLFSFSIFKIIIHVRNPSIIGEQHRKQYFNLIVVIMKIRTQSSKLNCSIILTNISLLTYRVGLSSKTNKLFSRREQISDYRCLGTIIYIPHDTSWLIVRSTIIFHTLCLVLNSNTSFFESFMLSIVSSIAYLNVLNRHEFFWIRILDLQIIRPQLGVRCTIFRSNLNKKSMRLHLSSVERFSTEIASNGISHSKFQIHRIIAQSLSILQWNLKYFETCQIWLE